MIKAKEGIVRFVRFPHENVAAASPMQELRDFFGQSDPTARRPVKP
jgi:hypothetical protein